MSICPVCNGFQTIEFTCSRCSTKMDDQGKISDYFDDYSPYMEIELMRLEDGYPENYSQSQCIHLFQCPNCQQEQITFIQE